MLRVVAAVSVVSVVAEEADDPPLPPSPASTVTEPAHPPNNINKKKRFIVFPFFAYPAIFKGRMGKRSNPAGDADSTPTFAVPSVSSTRPIVASPSIS